MGGTGGWIGVKISKDSELEIRVGVKEVLEMGMEVMGKGGASSEICWVGFLIGVEVDDSNGGRGGKDEDE